MGCDVGIFTGIYLKEAQAIYNTLFFPVRYRTRVARVGPVRFIVAAAAGLISPEVLHYIEAEDGGLIKSKAATKSDTTIHSNISCSADFFSFGVLLLICLLLGISEKLSLTAEHSANPLASLDAERVAYALRAGVQPYSPAEDDNALCPKSSQNIFDSL